MASGRRGGPPDLKSTLGSLLRTTLDQASAVRDVVEQQTRSRGGLLDQALTQRKRTAAMARLGEQVYRMAKRGEVDELLLEPEIGLLIGELEQLDDGFDEEDYNPRGATGPEAVSSADYAAQFDSASRDSRGTASTDKEYRVWRPVMPEDAAIIDADADFESGGEDDGENQRDTEDAGAAPEPIAAVSGSSRMPRRTAERRGGGIRFAEQPPRPEDPDSDDDLASYMHDDDVPEG